MKYKNKQIKIPTDFYKEAEKRQKACGFTSFTAYIISLINFDIRESEKATRVRIQALPRDVDDAKYDTDGHYI